HAAPRRPRSRCDPRSLRAVRAPDLLVLPAPAREPRGGRGCDAVDLPECLPWDPARRRPGVRVGMALQDRPERVPDAAALLLAPAPGGDAGRPRGDAGFRPRA